MNRTFTYNITSDDEGKSISFFLREFGFSHHTLVALKKTPGSVVCNDEPVFLNTILKRNDILKIYYTEEGSSENIVPSDIPLDIVYDDEDIMLINKQAKTPVHPSIRHYENTIANGLCSYFLKKNESFTFRCINRLDLDTTGLILIAKHAVSGAILSSDMTKRKIHRQYLAIAEGMTAKTGRICAPIGRADDSIIERKIDFENGDYAVTNYERLAYNNGYSLIKLKLETGRTHQIRVHMNYINHPLPGDYLYNPVYDKINRQPLHSYRLEFVHPVTKKPMDFFAPLPDDFKVFL